MRKKFFLYSEHHQSTHPLSFLLQYCLEIIPVLKAKERDGRALYL
jgi:hypothetical protein